MSLLTFCSPDAMVTCFLVEESERMTKLGWIFSILPSRESGAGSLALLISTLYLHTLWGGYDIPKRQDETPLPNLSIGVIVYSVYVDGIGRQS